MGQQQLLLLVLGIVIVGLAVVVGIEAFGENQKKSRIDEYTAMGVAMAGDVVAWYQKPTAQGGGGGVAANFADLTIDRLGYTRHDTGADRTGTSANGTLRYLYPNTTHPYFHIHPDPVTVGQPRVEVHVFGPHPECVVSRSDLYEVSATWSDGVENGGVAPPVNPNAARCTW